MNVESSVTQWITGLKCGDERAAHRLWERYFQRLVELSRAKHLGLATHGGVEGEDVAQSVFKSLCLGAEQGKFPQLNDRQNLWALLVTMTAYKSIDVVRRDQRLKRGGGRVIDETALTSSDEAIRALEEVIGDEPTPAFAAQVAEECQLLLGRLTDAERQTAELKLLGHTNQEIADRMGCGMRTVERRLRTARRVASTMAE